MTITGSLLKVKRPLEDRSFSVLVDQNEREVYILTKDPHLISTNTCNIPIQQDYLTDDNEASTAKRPRVLATKINPTIEGSERLIEDGFVTDYYTKVDIASINTTEIDPSSIAFVTIQPDLVFGSDEEDEYEAEDDEDSNAEDYYRNDYPDEDVDNAFYYYNENEYYIDDYCDYPRSNFQERTGSFFDNSNSD